MKVVTTIITILAVAGQSLHAGLQSHQSGEEDELVLTRYMERTQTELENQHLNTANDQINHEIDRLFIAIDFKLNSEIEQSLTETTFRNLPVPEDAGTESMTNFG